MWGARMTDGFTLMYKDLPGLQVVVHSVLYCIYYTLFGQLRLGPKFCQAQPAKGTLGRCIVQDIRRKLTKDCAVITPMLQSAHIIATPADVHEVLRTLGVLQMQPVAPSTLQAPMPPSISSDSSAQSTPTMPIATSTPITEQSVVPAEFPLPPPPCPKVLQFGIKDANHLRRAYPLLRHGHEKASWRPVGLHDC